MTTGSTGGDRLSKNQRREAARQKARELREAQKRKERRNRFLVQGGIIVAALVAVTVVALIIFTSVRPAGPGPKNMASDGIKIGQNLVAVRTPALPVSASPTQSKPNPSNVIDVRIYVDYQCPYCKQFEAANSQQLESLLDSGAITLEIHPIAILNRSSLGTKYSTRAAAAMACVANYSPDDYFTVNTAMFEHQPDEGTNGLTNDQIAKIITDAGVKNAKEITDCIKDQRFANWVDAATVRAAKGPIPGTTQISAVTQTPTVLVNGQYYQGAPGDANAFASFLAQAAGQVFNDTATPTPAPSPTP